MKFHNHETLWEYNRREHPEQKESFDSWEDFYAANAEDRRIRFFNEGFIIGSANHQSWSMNLVDYYWYSQTRPYYKVWPSIITPLCKIKLDISFDDIQAEEQTICIRFPVGFEPSTSDGKIRSIMAAVLPTYNQEHIKVLSVWPDIIRSDGRKCDATILYVSEQVDLTIEQQLIGWYFTTKDQQPLGISESISACVRFAVSVLILGHDPSIIEPEVLACDADKFARTNDPKYIDKARRRGVVGWSIGREFESCPHYRRPHLALRHTGKGKTIPKIVPVKGAIVHREKMTQVPTGHIMPNGQEVEV